MSKQDREAAEKRLLEIAVEKAEEELRTAKIIAEREELTREFTFEVMARECGRETAMRALQRIRLVDLPKATLPETTAPKLGTS